MATEVDLDKVFKQKLIHWNNRTKTASNQNLLGEEPLSIRIEGKPYAVVMRTPGDEFAHAAGFCLTEGIIDTPDELTSIGFCEDDDSNVVTLTLTPARREQIPEIMDRRGFISQTSCGLCGKELIKDLFQIITPLEDGQPIDIKKALVCLEALPDIQPLRRQTMASHAAAIYSADQELLWLEREGIKYKPDLIILVLSHNDILANTENRVYGFYYKPTFILRPTGVLELTNTPVPHFPVDVQALDADFLAFSSHKMCGPTGMGVLYGRRRILEEMPPFLGGGDMIKRVLLRSFKPNEIPYKFEAGTPAIAETVGLGVAVEYLSQVGMAEIAQHEHEIVAYALERLEEVPGVRVFGSSAEHKGGVAAFTLTSIHPHDISQILDTEGIAIRAGHHCAMPLHEKFCLPATARASFYLYNTKEEVDKLAESLYKVREVFGM